MKIYFKRGTYRFRDADKTQHKFATLQEAVDAGGIDETSEVKVSGIPYRVSSSKLNLATDSVEETGDK